jgi:hypothetical protein
VKTRVLKSTLAHGLTRLACVEGSVGAELMP